MVTTCLDNNVIVFIGVLVEVDNLRAEPSGHLVIHLPACVHQLFGQHHVAIIKSIVNPQSKYTRQKTYQVVLRKKREAQDD